MTETNRDRNGVEEEDMEDGVEGGIGCMKDNDTLYRKSIRRSISKFFVENIFIVNIF